MKGDLLYAEQISNTIRYDIPGWSGFGFRASYSLGNDDRRSGASSDFFEPYGKDGFAIGLKYDNGPVLLMANYDRLADSDESRFWNAGGVYTLNGFRISPGY